MLNTRDAFSQENKKCESWKAKSEPASESTTVMKQYENHCISTVSP